MARRIPMQIQITQSVSVFFLALGTKNTDANTNYPVCIGIFLCSWHAEYRCKYILPSLYRYFALPLARRIPMQIHITQSVSVFCPAIGTKNTDANTYYPVCIGIFLCSRHERHRCKHTIPSLYRYYSLLLARRIPMQIQITQSVSVFCPAILNFPTKILVNSPLQQKNRKHQIAVGVCGSFFIKLPLTSSLPWPCSCQR